MASQIQRLPEFIKACKREFEAKNFLGVSQRSFIGARIIDIAENNINESDYISKWSK